VFSLLLRERLASTRNGLTRTTLGPRIGFCPLSVNGQVSPVPEATIASDFGQAFDVQRHLAPQIAFDLVIAVDHLSQANNFVLGQVANAGVGVDAGRDQELPARRGPNPIDVLERDRYPLVSWNVDSSYACHAVLPLLLLVSRVLANYHDDTAPPDNPALVAAPFDGCRYFHRSRLPFVACESLAGASHEKK
jgi:hypothetical protein